MATLISLSIDMEKLDKSKIKNGRYLNLTVNLQDETGVYGHNASAYHEQTKEQREAGEKRKYVANGKVVWTDGKVVAAEWQDKATAGAKEKESEGR